jgi:hypothetical protein
MEEADMGQAEALRLAHHAACPPLGASTEEVVDASSSSPGGQAACCARERCRCADTAAVADGAEAEAPVFRERCVVVGGEPRPCQIPGSTFP